MCCCGGTCQSSISSCLSLSPELGWLCCMLGGKKYRDFQSETWNISVAADARGNISGKNQTNASKMPAKLFLQ